MQLVYRRKLDAVGIDWIGIVCVSLLAYRVWRSVWLGYLWLRHRHDGTKIDWLTFEDRYCIEYHTDPEISQILDEYVDVCVAQIREAWADERLDDEDADILTPAFYEVSGRLERAIAERIWQEDKSSTGPCSPIAGGPTTKHESA